MAERCAAAVANVQLAVPHSPSQSSSLSILFISSHLISSRRAIPSHSFASRVIQLQPTWHTAPPVLRCLSKTRSIGGKRRCLGGACRCFTRHIQERLRCRHTDGRSDGAIATSPDCRYLPRGISRSHKSYPRYHLGMLPRNHQGASGPRRGASRDLPLSQCRVIVLFLATARG